ncbi:hypothetical protein S83_069580 [Arachis hypogaea]
MPKITGSGISAFGQHFPISPIPLRAAQCSPTTTPQSLHHSLPLLIRISLYSPSLEKTQRKKNRLLRRGSW